MTTEPHRTPATINLKKNLASGKFSTPKTVAPNRPQLRLTKNFVDELLFVADKHGAEDEYIELDVSPGISLPIPPDLVFFRLEHPKAWVPLVIACGAVVAAVRNSKESRCRKAQLRSRADGGQAVQRD